ncbi:meiosis protein SPO22/ZIP4 like-domain-containing protein [Aspergillus varians]
MAANHSSKSKDQAWAILALATDLQNQLTHNDDSDTLTLSNETQELLEKTLHRLPLLTDSTSASTRRQLDKEGTNLWNMRKLRAKRTEENHDFVLICKVKALAYAMLDATAPKTGSGNYRSLELAFKVVKACIENGLINLSQKMMESAATRLDLMERSKPDTDMAKFEAFSTEYYMLRIHLAWSQERPDIADHLFSKIPETKTIAQQRVVVGTCYTIGDMALRAGQYDTATIWLGRAVTVCEPWSGDGSHGIAQRLKDKRLLVLHAYARSNLHFTTAASEGQLRRALDLLRTEYGSSFPVLVFSLEVLSKEDELNEEYFETLQSSIKEMDDGDMIVKIVYHYITKIRSLSLERFVEACGLLLAKLAVLDMNTKDQWMEKIFVSVIWAVTNTNSSSVYLPNLVEAAAQALTESSSDMPSENAAQASLVLIWKYIDTMVSKGFISIGEQWCRFLLKQPMFQKTPDIEAKAFRKLIRCVLEQYNPSTARQIFEGIPEACKTCPFTLYLLYRLALLADDLCLTTVYIQSLCKQGADAKYIWSCVADALHLGKTSIAIQSLEDVMAISDDNSFEKLQISQILQYVICTTRKDNLAHREDLLGRITSLLGSALTAAETGQRKPFSSVELRWFSWKSYSIALELYKLFSAQVIIKLLNISTNFMELDQKETGAESNTGLLDHHLKCAFLQSMIMVTEARREKSSAKKEHHYKEVRRATKQFRIHIQSLGLDSVMDPHPHTWLDKYRIILSFDFEATVFLRQWNDLAKVIETSKPIISARLSSVFLDCLLRSGAPSSYISQFVKQMIRTFHSSPSPYLNPETDSYFTEYLPRHLRCLLTLSIQAEEYILAESVLDQALILARNNNNTNNSTQAPHYPKDELQWLATTAFNRAVEFFLVSADGECRRWAGKAIALADLIEDDRGELGRLLRRNFEKLQPGPA